MNATFTLKHRTSLLAVGLFAAIFAGFAGVSGCQYCTVTFDPQPSEPIDLGVAVDLHALAYIGDVEGNREYSHLAAGADGAVLAWGFDYARDVTQFVETSDLGDADLRAVWIDGEEYASTSWWVVGDAGTVAVSDNRGATWNPITLPGGTADLHGISGFAGRPVIVGDEVVLVRVADGTWIEPPLPPGGWGQLRGVGSTDERVYAVGLGGAVWSASDPRGQWIAENVGVDVDLFDVSRLGDPYFSDTVIAVGAEGTVLIGEPSGWSRPDTGVSVDLIDCDNGYALGADGGIYEIATNGPLMLKETIEGARALSQQYYWYAATTVGIGGLATTPPADDC
jgi:hypothetical protein